MATKFDNYPVISIDDERLVIGGSGPAPAVPYSDTALVAALRKNNDDLAIKLEAATLKGNDLTVSLNTLLEEKARVDARINELESERLVTQKDLDVKSDRVFVLEAAIGNYVTSSNYLSDIIAAKP